MSAVEKEQGKNNVSTSQSWEAFINYKKLRFPTNSINKATEKVQKVLKLVYKKRHK